MIYSNELEGSLWSKIRSWVGNEEANVEIGDIKAKITLKLANRLPYFLIEWMQAN